MPILKSRTGTDVPFDEDRPETIEKNAETVQDPDKNIADEGYWFFGTTGRSYKEVSDFDVDVDIVHKIEGRPNLAPNRRRLI